MKKKYVVVGRASRPIVWGPFVIRQNSLVRVYSVNNIIENILNNL